MKTFIFLLPCLFFLACNSSKSETTEAEPRAPVTSMEPSPGTSTKAPEAPVPAVEKSQGPNSRVICKAPSSVTNDPRSIQDVVNLINALPKPLSVACFIDSLKGPFKVSATASTFSAQPAVSAWIPRIFLIFDTLFVSVVPTGEGGEVIEVSVKTSAQDSIKGEIPFPVQDKIANDLPFTHIINTSSPGTICGTCHFGETQAPSPYPQTAFVSRFLLPPPAYNVTAAEIEESARRCATSKLRECPVLEAVTSKGPLIQGSFE